MHAMGACTGGPVGSVMAAAITLSVLRGIFTCFVAQMLTLAYVKLIGGILILWIAVKLFIEGAPGNTDH